MGDVLWQGICREIIRLWEERAELYKKALEEIVEAEGGCGPFSTIANKALKGE